MINTGKLPEFMRLALYNSCLLGASYLIGGCHHRTLSKISNRPVEMDIMASSCRLSMHPLGEALFLLRAKPIDNAQTLHDDDIEAAVIELITMSADGIDPNRPSPTDEDLTELVQTVHAYAADRHAKYKAMEDDQSQNGDGEA